MPLYLVKKAINESGSVVHDGINTALVEATNEVTALTEAQQLRSDLPPNYFADADVTQISVADSNYLGGLFGNPRADLGNAGGNPGLTNGEDLPLPALSVGKYPTDLTAVSTLTGWWRADRKQAIVVGDTPIRLHGWRDEADVAPEDGRTFESNAFGDAAIVVDAGATLNNQTAVEIGDSIGATTRPMQTDISATQNLPVHIFMVMAVQTFITNAYWYDSSAGTNRLGARQNAATTVQQVNSAASGFVNALTIPATGVGFVYDTLFDGAGTSFQRADNGTKAAGSAAGQAAWNGLVIGGSGPDASGAISHYYLAELIRFNAELTGQDLTDLFAYLNDRYGLPN